MDTQRMLDDFYSAADRIPQEYLFAPFDSGSYLPPECPKGTEIQLYDQWCYKAWVIDFYFYTWQEVADALRSGKTFYEVLELAEESLSEFYSSQQCKIGALCGINDIVFGEAMYDDGQRKDRTIFGVSIWCLWEHTGPVTALVLTDELMSALENEGFNLGRTKATSVLISGHSAGLYFDDGGMQRYYPQIILGGQDNFPLSNYVFYSPEELIESF